MSYQVLARKWRPQNFEELVGQEHVLGALINALENERLHHAYLFSGTRGVGKTTIARILARSLNCETGITAKPCGECSACKEISEGRFVDLIEVDAASRTKVEDTRDLLENVQYKPTRGRFKIYLIDEVHMLSNHSFNALLKTLEEPPEHVKFLLATTDPQKLPVTVLSRCLQFNLKNLPAQRISEYLEQILGEEKLPFEKAALGHLARAAAGSMRDALSLTDQAISSGGGKLAEQDVVDMLGTVDRKRIYEIVDAICGQDAAALLDACQNLRQYSVDYAALLEEMLALFHAVAVHLAVPEADFSGFGDAERIAGYSAAISPEDVQLNYQMLLMGRKDLSASPDLHVGFEMLMLRLLAFQPEAKGAAQRSQTSSSDNDRQSGIDISTPESESSKLEEDRPPKKPEASVETAQELLSNASSAHANINRVSAVVPQPGTLDRDNESSIESGGIESTENKSKEGSIAEHQGSEENSTQSAAELSAPKDLDSLTPDTWIQLFRELSLTGSAKSVISHMVLERQEAGQMNFKLAEAGQPLFKASHQQRLADALTTHFGEPIDVSVEMGAVGSETPAENTRRLHREALEKAEKDMLDDPVIIEFVEEFEAELVPNSVTFFEKANN